jgi:hypothetical protein
MLNISCGKELGSLRRMSLRWRGPPLTPSRTINAASERPTSANHAIWIDPISPLGLVVHRFDANVNARAYTSRALYHRAGFQGDVSIGISAPGHDRYDPRAGMVLSARWRQ